MIPHQPHPAGRNTHLEALVAGSIPRIQVWFRNRLAVDCEPSRGVTARYFVAGKPDDALDVGAVTAGDAQPAPGLGKEVQNGACAAVERGERAPAVEDNDVSPPDRLGLEIGA